MSFGWYGYDDPPGLPRIITCEKNLDRFLKLYDHEYNGLTFCTGSLGKQRTMGSNRNLKNLKLC